MTLVNAQQTSLSLSFIGHLFNLPRMVHLHFWQAVKEISIFDTVDSAFVYTPTQLKIGRVQMPILSRIGVYLYANKIIVYYLRILHVRALLGRIKFW